MAAHRYWALLMTARAGSGDGVGVAEVQMRATSGGANIAVGGTASGVNNVGQPPSNAFDGNTATIWHNGATGGNPTRLSYDFAAQVTVTEITVRVPGATGSGSGFPGATYGPALVWVQWSDDGTLWRFAPLVVDLSALGNDAVATISGISDTLLARVVGANLRMPNRWPAGGLSVRPAGGTLRYDSVDGGAYRIAGTVAIDGTPVTPVSRRVRLFHRLSGRLVRETWSRADGTWEFTGLALAEYVPMVDDYTRTYDADVADAVVAVR